MKLLAPLATATLFLGLAACNLSTTTPADRIEAALTASALASSMLAPSETPRPQDAPVATSEPTALLATESVAGPGLNPLTGLVVADPSKLDRSPVAVKISNYPRSVRPQWGLSLADIVYEYYINNDLTRFYAIFYGQDAPLAGPIRSGRIFDIYLTDIYKDVLVFASADAVVLDRMYESQPNWRLVGLLDGPACPPNPVCRYGDNSLVADTAAVSAYAARLGGAEGRPNLKGMTFNIETPVGGQPVAHIFNYYSYSAYSYWDYNAETGRYLRYQDTQENLGSRPEDYHPLTDRLNNEQVAADNVVVLYIPHFHVAYTPATSTEPAGEIVDMEFEGDGLAYAFRDGQAYELVWLREEGEPLYLVDAAGQPYDFKPGSTWFQVYNDDSNLTAGNDSWRFEFVFRRP